jgi:methionyl aminopeptidase
VIGRPGKLRGPQLYTHADIAALDSAAFCARTILAGLCDLVSAGVTGLDIERACRERILAAGAQPAMPGVPGPGGEPFGYACSISVDEAIAHARPTGEPLRDGQLATIDLMLALDGWHADVAESVVVGGGGHPLLAALDAVWAAGLGAIGPGVAWVDVAQAMADAARAGGVRMIGGLSGHGIGLAGHELPELPLTPMPGESGVVLRPGMVFTLEPVLTSGAGEYSDSGDGWALSTADGDPAVGREAVIAVESDGFRVLGGGRLDDSRVASGYNPLRTGQVSGE